jgi:hypothetical protein
LLPFGLPIKSKTKKEQNEKLASDLAEDYSTRLLHGSTWPTGREETRRDAMQPGEEQEKAGRKSGKIEKERRQTGRQPARQPGPAARIHLAKACGSGKMVR